MAPGNQIVNYKPAPKQTANSSGSLFTRIPQEPANANTVYNLHGGKDNYMYKNGLNPYDTDHSSYALSLARSDARQLNQAAEAQQAAKDRHIADLHNAMNAMATQKRLIDGDGGRDGQWEITVKVRGTGRQPTPRELMDRYLEEIE